MAGEVKLVIDGAIARMYISNPKRKNALSQSMWEEIKRHCEKLKQDHNIRVLAISGEEGNFAAGADISEKLNSDRFAGSSQMAEAAFKSIEELPFPVVGILEGYVLGGGLVLAAACDLRIAADNAKFSIPGAKRGIGVERSNVERVVRLTGPAKAMEVLFIGEMFSAEKALTYGLVNELVPTQELSNRVERILNVLVQNAPLSIKAAKLNVRSVWNRESWEGEDPAEQCYLSEDFKEGIRAFAEKREPNFIGM